MLEAIQFQSYTIEYRLVYYYSYFTVYYVYIEWNNTQVSLLISIS
jgi:hypothetical protein